MVAGGDIAGSRRSAGVVVPLLRGFAAWTMRLALFMLAASPMAVAEELPEHEVKAAFLYNFSKFVDWPQSKLDPADERLFLCVVGEDPVIDALQATVHDKTARGKRLTVEHLGVGDELQRCHILFVGRVDGLYSSAIINEVRDEAVLTVGDSEDFALRGGMINFRIQDRKVRFEINAAAAAAADLRISSQLLKLAIRVIGEPPPE